jgi:elongation factor Ts
MEITAALVKELRDRTWIWMMECKKALAATNGDIELAIEELRKKWLAKAASKADREALEWGIKIVVEGNKAYVVSVSCETDFLANSDRFKDMLNDVVSLLKAGKTAEDAKAMIDKDYSLEMGENLQVRDFQVLVWASIWAYVHSNNKLAAVVVAKKEVEEEKLKQVAMHVTAANPDFLSASDISSEVIEKEKSIQLEIMKNDPKMAWKPDNVLLTIIDGKMSKFASEVSLLEQQFVINPDIKVKDFVWADSLSAFYRFSI